MQMKRLYFQFAWAMDVERVKRVALEHEACNEPNPVTVVLLNERNGEYCSNPNN